jgi:putative redox protein
MGLAEKDDLLLREVVDHAVEGDGFGRPPDPQMGGGFGGLDGRAGGEEKEREDAHRAKDKLCPMNWMVTVEEEGPRFAQRIRAGRHALAADEPAEAGGQDRGPNPYELLLSALGACTSMTLRMYADHKKWPLRHVTVRLRHKKIHAQDCGDCETREGKIDFIEREVVIDGDLSADQRARLLEIADRCPVHRTLTSEVKIVTR